MGADLEKMTDAQLWAIAKGSQPRAVGAMPGRMEIEAHAIENAPSPVERIGAGVSDLAQGAKQKFLNWTDPVAAQAYTAKINDERALYQRGVAADASARGLKPSSDWWRPGEDFDWWRMGGNVAASAPAALVPGGGTSLLARAGYGALQAAPTGYFNFSERNDPVENLARTGMAAGIGAVANVAVPSLIDMGMKALQWGKNTLTSGVQSARGLLTPEATQTAGVRSALQGVGVNFDDLSTAAQAAIRQEAAAQLRATGALNAEQLARKADIETIVGPGAATTAQVTRSPRDWTIERNLQKTEVNLPAVRTGDQETITGRLQLQDNATKIFSQKIGTQTGGTAGTPLEAGARAIETVQANVAARNKVVGKLYDEYRAMGMKDAPVPEEGLVKALTNIGETRGRVEDILPSAVLNRLKEFGFLGGERTRYLTIHEADNLNKVLNSANDISKITKSASAAIHEVKDAVNESLIAIPVGKEASKALLTARQAAAENFASQRAGLAVSRAVEDVAPDKFLQQNVIGGAVRDLKALKDEIGSSKSWDDLRGQAWEWIHGQATNGGRAPFSGARLDDTLRGLGKERLEVLFTKAELDAINTLRRGSLAMTYAPPFSAVNNSNTTPAMLGQLLRLGNRVPGLNVLTQPIANDIEQAAAQGLLTQALSGSGAQATRAAADQAQRAAVLRAITGTGNVPGLLGATVPSAYAAQNQRQIGR